MKVRYQFRFYPTKAQQAKLAKVFGCCRYAYNRALRYRTDAWQERQERIGYNHTSAELTKWKREEETAWLREVSCVPVQQALRHLNNAFVKFFNKESKYPTFKKRSHKQSAEYTTSAFKFSRPDPNNPNLIISGLGRLDVNWSRKFLSEPTTVTITKRPSGRYFVTLVLDEQFSKLEPTGKTAGVDLGINRLATTSDAERIPNPKHTSKNQAHLAKAQRILSRRVKNSGMWNRQRIRVARIQEHISNARKDHLNKVTTDLIRRYDRISIEDLNIRGMVKCQSLSKALSDASFGQFRQMLDYKCERYGRELRLVDRFFPSSKRCHCCGHILDRLPLDTREWDCPECGAHHDRDLNAAKNIHNARGHLVKASGGKIRRFKPSGLNRTSRRSSNHPVKCVLHV